jgi:hypothetical protein
VSILFGNADDEAQCVGEILPDPIRRSRRCAYRAEYVVLPTERPMCFDHCVDFIRSRPITAFDVARSHCETCQAVQRGEHERKKEERRGRMRGGDRQPAPRSRGREEVWCEEHDAQAFAAWKLKQPKQDRGPR